MDHEGRNPIILVAMALVLVFAGAGVYALASEAWDAAPYTQDVQVCQNFCALAQTEYGFVDEDQNCNCLVTQRQVDPQNNVYLEIKQAVNAGRIVNLTAVQPIPQEIVDMINQELQRQALLQQQQQGQ